MYWLNGNIMRLVIVGIVAAMVMGGGNAKADFTFGTPKNLGMPVNSGSYDGSPCISSDGLELYFTSLRVDGYGSCDLWVSTRQTKDDEWGEPNNLGELINSDKEDANPTISADGCELYFNSFRMDGLGGTDLWVARRATKSDPWSELVNLGPPINSAKAESAPCISADGLELYFSFSDPCLPDDDPSRGFYVSKRETTDAPWGEPIILDPVVNSWPSMWECEISSDGLVLMWADYWDGDPRPGGLGDTDLWYSRRATKDSSWSEPVNLGPNINTPFSEEGPSISADGSKLFLSAPGLGRSSTYNLWQAPILPVVDFDSDGIVAINDLLILIESWGTDDSQCDVGPMPWGDGVVDDADLEVLMIHWGQDLNAPPPLPEPIAHWKLDESEGTVAYDSAGTNDANLVGDPLWQPAGGWLDGALELDGVDDGAQAGFLFDPLVIPFSAFAWIKGGAPDQVIISQAKGDIGKGINWLLTDSVGNLKSEFIWLNDDWSPGPDLFSSAQITDGQWHHVGFVWDLRSATRIIYVDGIEVVKDTMQNGFFALDHQDGGINIGFRASILHLPVPGVFSGLIDDVRIYDRALTPEQIEALAQ